jgi:hypothetical protein
MPSARGDLAHQPWPSSYLPTVREPELMNKGIFDYKNAPTLPLVSIVQISWGSTLVVACP